MELSSVTIPNEIYKSYACTANILYSSFNMWSVNAQKLHVAKSKRAFLGDQKIKKGSTLSYSDIVYIKRNGTLTLMGSSSKLLELNQGYHKLEAKYLEHLKLYQHHDSIFNELKMLGFENCEFSYDYVLVSHNAHALVGRIIVHRDSTLDESSQLADYSIVNTNEKHSVQINWTNPDKNYQGKYYILVEDMFGDFQELLDTYEQYFKFNLSKYISDQDPFLLFTIIAEDCRKSDQTLIMLEAE